MKKAVIFDVDGVLLDSVPFHYRAWEKAFNEYGLVFSFEDYLQKVNGLPRLTGVRNMLPFAADSELEEVAAKKQSYLLKLLEVETIQPLEGVVGLLERLAQKGSAIISASSSKNAPALLEKARLTTFFSKIISGNDFKKSKPDPEIFLTAALMADVNPSECVVIEDATLGIQAAKNAGMKAIGLLSSGDHEIKSYADLCIDTIAEYQKIIEFIS